MDKHILSLVQTEVAAFFRGLVDPRGRTTRSGYFTYIILCSLLGSGIASLTGAAIDGWLTSPDSLSRAMTGLLLLVPTVRRLHDAGYPGWFSPVVPANGALTAYGWYLFGTQQALTPALDYPLNMAGWVLTLACFAIFFWPPTKGENRFGPVPRIRLRRAAA